MKKIAKLIVLLLLIAVPTAKAQERVVIHATTSGTLTDPTEDDDLQRSPVYIPSVLLTDYTLLFEESCIGCQVQILQDEELVYSTSVDENGKVVLPAPQTGECELRLFWASIVFVGEFELQ